MINEALKRVLNNSRLGSEFQKFNSQYSLQVHHVFSGSFGDIPWDKLKRKQKQLTENLLNSLQLGLILTVPIIWSVAIPLALLDLMATLYQVICFPVYNIPTVVRSEFVIMDRHKLSYLDLFEKLNCIYCGYGNGVLAYVREIASRTEARWCPIKHAKPVKKAHSRYEGFAEYGDGNGYCAIKNRD